MPSPLDASVLVGYVEAEDLYIVFSEYYGDGTIYGRREMSLPSGEPVRGAGKTWGELLALSPIVADEVAGALNGHLIHVPAEVPAEAPAEPPAEAPVEPPMEPPVEPPAEAPVEAPVQSSAPFTVRLELCGTTITYENVKRVDVKGADGCGHSFF